MQPLQSSNQAFNKHKALEESSMQRKAEQDSTNLKVKEEKVMCNIKTIIVAERTNFVYAIQLLYHLHKYKIVIDKTRGDGTMVRATFLIHCRSKSHPKFSKPI